MKKVELVDWTEKQYLWLQEFRSMEPFFFLCLVFLGKEKGQKLELGREMKTNQWMKEN